LSFDTPLAVDVLLVTLPPDAGAKLEEAVEWLDRRLGLSDPPQPGHVRPIPPTCSPGAEWSTVGLQSDNGGGARRAEGKKNLARTVWGNASLTVL